MAAKRVRLPKRTARLIFDGEYEGIEVVMSLEFSIDVVLSFLRNGDESQERPAKTQKEQLTELKELGALGLISWNLEDDQGMAILANAAGLGRVSPAFASLLLTKWTEALVNPPAPLSATLPAGNTQVGPTLQMVCL